MQRKDIDEVHKALLKRVEDLKFLYDTENVVIMVGVEVEDAEVKKRSISIVSGTAGFLTACTKQINMQIDELKRDG